MKIPGMTWFVEKLLHRMRALVWGMLASDVETESLLHQAANQNRLEEFARQLDNDGQSQQAEALRQRAAQLSPHSPAGTALDALADVRDDKLSDLTESDDNNSRPKALPAPKRSRSRSRRPSRRKKPATTENSVPNSPADSKPESL